MIWLALRHAAQGVLRLKGIKAGAGEGLPFWFLRDHLAAREHDVVII
jgi:hypothetical protein